MHEVDATLGELPVHIRFRLPDGTAQEVAAREASNDLSRAGTALLRASIIEVTGPCGEILDTASTLDALREPLEEAWARLDPAAGLVTTVVCPLCDTTVEVLFDSFSLLAAELRYTSSILLEVHRLASAYHWTEAEILALPTRRRRGYLSLIDKGVAA